MHKDLTEELSIEDYKMELENRIRNLLWTVSGDYTLDVKPDVSLFLRSKEIALYDGIKQGAFARYFDKNLLGLYLVKKIYLDASETELTGLTQLCIEAAVGERICEERPGVRRMRKKALEDILDQEYETLPSYDKLLDRLKIAVFRDVLTGSVQPLEKKLSAFRDQIYACAESGDTMELIRIIDSLYNTVIDPDFEKKNGSLERVMAVTLEELTEFGWEDYLNEEMYEEALENYVEKLTDRMTDIEDSSLTQGDGRGKAVETENYSFASGGVGKSPHLCGTEFWKNLSHTCRRKKNEPSYVPGNTRRLQPVFYRRNPEKSGS
mgnify:CR=1 FL=1